MMENEELEVLLAYSEGDGWVKARNYKGEEGYVPQNYLDLHADDQVPEASAGDDDQNQNVHQHPAIAEEVEPEEEEDGVEAEAGDPMENQISFSSVDYTYQHSVGEEDEFPGPDEDATPAAVQAAAPVISVESDKANVIVGYCRALYDYDATSDEELTFYEGEVIAILRRTGIHGEDVDDGWWEGQLLPDGPKGVFPSLVVEDCGPNGEELTPKVYTGQPAKIVQKIFNIIY